MSGTNKEKPASKNLFEIRICKTQRRKKSKTGDCRQPAAAFGNAACCEPTASVMQEFAISRVCPVAAGCVTESGSRLPTVTGASGTHTVDFKQPLRPSIPFPEVYLALSLSKGVYNLKLHPVSLIILLFTIGLLLLAAEVMIPGGILGIAGGVLLFAGCVLSFVQRGPSEGMAAIGVTVVAAIIVFYIQFRILPKTRFGKRFFLEKSISGTSSEIGGKTRDLVGKTAQSVTVLSPSGYVTIDDVRYEAISQSGQIPKNTELIVTATNSFQLTVRLKS